jgi:hypothetical protein
MANLEGLVSVVSRLRLERTNLVDQLKHVDVALSALGKLKGAHSDTKPRRSLSASARQKIAVAQRERWARAKEQQKIVPIAKGNKSAKRTMSVSARRKIAAAQRARWAKVRAKEEKKAA